MATITQQIPNYHGGISQQADEVKAPGQVNKLKNAIPDVVQGLVKRPGTKLLTAAGNIAKIDHDKWFHYYRDENEQYIGRIDRSTGDIKMWDKTGTVKTVVYDSSTQTAIKNYLRYPYVSGTIDASNPVPTEDELQTLTINDYTYLTNRNVTVKMDKAATTDINSVGYNPVRPAEAYIELKKVAYARQYAVNLFDDNTTQDVTTATRVKIEKTDSDDNDQCPHVDTQIFNINGFKLADGTVVAFNNKFTDSTWSTSDGVYSNVTHAIDNTGTNPTLKKNAVQKLTLNKAAYFNNDHAEDHQPDDNDSDQHADDEFFLTDNDLAADNPSRFYKLKNLTTGQQLISAALVKGSDVNTDAIYAKIVTALKAGVAHTGLWGPSNFGCRSDAYTDTQSKGGSTWAANKVYRGGDQIIEDGKVFTALVGIPTLSGNQGSGRAGVTHSTTEPTWPTTLGAVVDDNGTSHDQLRWKYEGPAPVTGQSGTFSNQENAGTSSAYADLPFIIEQAATDSPIINLKFKNGAAPVGEWVLLRCNDPVNDITLTDDSQGTAGAIAATGGDDPTIHVNGSEPIWQGKGRERPYQARVDDNANGTYNGVKATAVSSESTISDDDTIILRDLYFRLTTTGQSVATGETDAITYKCRYTTTYDLLHGGRNWGSDLNQFNIAMKSGSVYQVTIQESSTAKEQANIALVRPTPTSFDTKTTVTAESIIGSIRKEIIDHNTFSYVQNNGSGGAGQLITITKPGHGLTADDDIDVEFLDPNSGTKPNNFSGNILAITTDTIIFATDTTSQQISGKCILDFTNTNVRQVGNGLYVTRTNNKFGISTSDSDLLNVFTNEIQDVADLPSQCKHDYKLKVRNSEEEADDYYLKFEGQEKQDGTFLDGKGVWEECAEPGRNIKLDYSTMPITLIRTKDGNFRVAQLDGGYYHFTADVKTGVYTSNTNTNSILFGLTNHGFEVGDVVRIEQGDSSGGTIPAAYYTIDLVPGTNNFYVTSDANIGNNGSLNCKVYPTYSHKKWAECTVGSWNDKSFTGTVPEPSFVNYKINKVISFRNRLGILSDENVNLSRPGDFDDFWPISAIAYSAGDNIDVSCSSIHPAILYDAIEINSGLLLFSENEQFMLTTDSDVLSPLTAKINSFCTYNFNKKTSPISLGTTVGFLDNAARYSRFFEATNLLREGTPDVFEQSKIVSRLLPKELTLIANSRENSIIFFSERGSKTVYGLKYLTGGDRRLQQAWFTWEMSSPIQHMALMDDALYFILRENTTTTWDGALTYSDTIQKIKLKLDDDSSYLLDLGAEGSEYRNITDNDILYNVHLDNYVRLDYNDFHDRNPDLLFTMPAAFNKTNLHAKYTRSNGSTICFIYRNSHGFKTGQKVYIDFVDNSLVGGTIPTDNEFTVTLHTENYFQITIPTGNAVQGICRVTAILGVVEAQNEPGSDSTWDFSQNGRYGKVIPYDDTGTLKGKAKGNWTTISDGDNEGVYLGYLFDMEVEFPTIYPVKTANNNIISDYTGGLVIHRVKLNLGHHAIHEVELERGWPNRYFGSSVITSRDKTTYNEALGPLTSDTPPVVATDYYSASYVMHFKDEGQQVIPIYEKNKNLTLTFKSTSPSPATLYSMTWEGDYTNNHYERVT